MADEHSGNPALHGNPPWLTALASLTVGAAFFALWFWLLPGWLGFTVETAGAGRWRWLAAIPSVLGFAVTLRCVWDFGRTGRGTPAPVAPPKRLVVVGFYRYVRNPMYVGFAVGWIGLWIVFGHPNPVAIAVVAAVALGVHLFVVFYEEPTLHKKFGTEYEEYCRNVRRWWPRVRGYAHFGKHPVREGLEVARHDREVFQLAHQYLRTLDSRIPSVIGKYLRPDPHPTELWQIYRCLVDTATTPHMLPSVVAGALGSRDVEAFRPWTFDFNPQEVLRRYRSWEDVRDAIETGLTSKGTSLRNSKKYWPQLCKAVLSGAEFLMRFPSTDGFFEWCDIFDRDDLTRPGLPLIIANNVQGFGFALGCEFVKELGYTNYGKPDVQVITLFLALGLTERQPSDTRIEYGVLQDMFRAARNNGVTTYELDKVFWLIGSGDFYKDSFRIGGHRDEFIEYVRRELEGRRRSA